MKKNTRLHDGFTLVEVLVAITLLLMVIVGPLQIIARTNNSTAFASEQMTAWFLAQEGLELAQQARDGYLLNYFNNTTTHPWTDFVDPSGQYGPCFKSTGCGLFVNNDGSVAVTDCGVFSCQLFQSTANTPATRRASYIHVLASGSNPAQSTQSKFTRVVTLKETGSGREVAATSTVTWRTGSLIAGQKVETATFLFNIYDKP